MPSIPRIRYRSPLIALLLATLPLIGCAATDSEAKLDELAEEADEVFGAGQAIRSEDLDPLRAEPGAASPDSGSETRQPRGATDDGITPGGWGVLLAAATGPDARAQMEAQRALHAETLGRRDVRVSRQRSGYAVVLGSYDTPGDPAAQRDLEFVKSFEVDGRRPYPQAHMMPPGQRAEELAPATPGAREEWNLATVSRSLGGEAGFTLQIGVFESVDRNQAMQAAENWTRELRGEGEEAYFYHGRSASMVSLGVFGKEDWDALFDVAAPHVRELQRRFPTLRLERMDDRRRNRAAEPDTRPSMLVIIPER